MKLRTIPVAALTIVVCAAVLGLIAFGMLDFFSEDNETEQKEQQAPQTEPAHAVSRKIKRLPATENPGYAEAFAEAERLMKNGDLRTALAAYGKAAELEPKAIEPLMRMGTIALALLEYDTAEAYFANALRIAPHNAEALRSLAQTAIKKRDLVGAQKYLNQINPPTDHSTFLQALIFAVLNQSEQSQTLLREVIAETPNPQLKEQAQLMLRQYEIFALNRDGKIVHLQALLADALNELGEEELALALGFEALKFQHDYRDIWLIIGHASLKLGKFRDAEDALRKAVELDSRRADAHFFLGIAQKENGKSQDANKSFNQAKSLGYEPAILITQKQAPLLENLGEYEAAMAAYEELLRFDATDISTFKAPIALALDKLGDTEKALTLARWAAQVHTNSALAYTLRGRAELGAGLTSAAKQSIEKALELDPHNQEAQKQLERIKNPKPDEIVPHGATTENTP